MVDSNKKGKCRLHLAKVKSSVKETHRAFLTWMTMTFTMDTSMCTCAEYDLQRLWIFTADLSSLYFLCATHPLLHACILVAHTLMR